MPWETLRQRLEREWRGGECVTIIGPRGSGKTHIAVELAELRRYVLVLATKRVDPLISDLRQRGYLVTGDLNEVTWAYDEWAGRKTPIRPRVVYWPQYGERVDGKARKTAQARAMREALEWADRTGGWTVFIDETMWMVETLRLDREIKELYFQGRTQGLSGVALAQRPSHVPRIVFSSSDYLFLAQTGDRRDIVNLREISSGIPTDVIEAAVRQLDAQRHEFLFIDTKRRELARVTAPPR